MLLSADLPVSKSAGAPAVEGLSTTGGSGASARPARSRVWSFYRFLAPLGRPYRWLLVKGLLATIALVAARLAFPWPMRAVIQATQHRGHHATAVLHLVPSGRDPTYWLVGSFLAIILVWGISEHLSRLTFARFAAAVARDARGRAMRVIARSEHEAAAPDLVASVTRDCASFKTGLRAALINTTRNGLFFVAATVIIALIDLQIGLVFLSGGVLTIGLGLIGAHRISKITARLRSRELSISDAVGQLREEPDPDDPTRSGVVPSSKQVRVEGQTTMAIHAGLALCTAGVLALCLERARAGKISAGDIFTILVYVLYLHNKTVSMGRRTARFGRLLIMSERLAELIQRPGRPPSPPDAAGTTKPAAVAAMSSAPSSADL